MRHNWAMEWEERHEERSPDGRFQIIRNASGDYDNSSSHWRVIHLATGRCVALFSGSTHDTAGGLQVEGYCDVRFSEDGRFVQASLWDGPVERIELTPQDP